MSHFLFCVECCVATDEFELGWRGFLTDEEYGPAEVAILCPACAEREFGPRQLRLRIEEE